MNKILLTGFLTAILLSVKSQPYLSGKIHMSEGWGETLYVLRLDRIDLNYFELVDSIRLSEDGSFNYAFRSDATHDLLYKITLPPKGENFRYSISGENDNYFIISTQESDSLTLEADADSLYYSVQIRGGKINRSLLIYRDHSKPFFQIHRAWKDSIKRHPDKKDSLDKVMTQNWMEQIEEYKALVSNTLDTANNTSIILAGLCYLNSAYLGILPGEVIKRYLSKVEHLDIPMVRNAMEIAESVQANRTGLILPDIEFRDGNGDSHSLNEVAGNITVVDFWASWCNPCRQANKTDLPEIHKSFEKDPKKKLISISIDKDKTKWQQAVESDRPAWPQYIDDSRAFANLLSVHAVPLYLVLDEQKRIIYETISVYHLKHFLSNMDRP
jgi:thiol-disulfide isomerase/thioredoxin